MARPLRYSFILALVGACTVLAAVGGWRFARASAPVSGPIILISVDALRADRLPAYGYRGLMTPAIDRLAADGIVFERAYSHAPMTLPAHAALLSGRLPFSTGVRADVGFTLPDHETTLAEVLDDRAYATAGIVSSYRLRRETGIAQGFAFFDDDVRDELWAGDVEGLERDGMASVALAEEWLSTTGGERAFLFLHLNEPQARASAPALSADESYDAAVALADAAVARLLDYLQSHQLYDQSTVILLADHGEGLGDHGEQGHGLLLYDEALRVPLVIKPAASERGGRRVRDLVQLVDLMPTIVDLAKAPLPDDVDGESLVPLLEAGGRLASRSVYAESLYGFYHFGWSGVRSLTDGRYRFVSAPGEELYDLDDDPGMQRNIIDERPEEADRLRAALERFVASDDVPAAAAVPEDIRERLATLGSVGGHDSGPTAPGAGTVPGPPVDPKDRVALVEAYRRATRLLADGRWPQAIAAFQRMARSEATSSDLWRRLATASSAAGRHDVALDAYRRLTTLQPENHEARLGAAAALVALRRLDDAQRQAELVLDADAPPDAVSRASAFDLLVRIALAKRDTAAARAYASDALAADPGLPLASYVEGRAHYDAGRYAEALPPFEEALAAAEEATVAPADLWWHAADTLVRLSRPDEAEPILLADITRAPRQTASRAALAGLYHAAGLTEEAGQAVADLLRFSPTPDAYNLATRLWIGFGDPDQAAAIRAEAVRRSASVASGTAVR